MKSVLFTGSSGQLGFACKEIFPSKFNSLFTSKNAQNESCFLDISNEQSIKTALDRFRPDVVVNLAAYTDVDGCEKSPKVSKEINLEGLKNLCNNFDGHIIQISTDYVFDGESGPYLEKDKTNPISVYGKHKLAAENFLIENRSKYSIIRSNVLYGNVKSKACFLAWVVGSLSSSQKINVVEDQWGNPTSVYSLARFISFVVKNSVYGLYHYADKGIMSRYDFAIMIAKIFKLNPSLIIPIQSSQLKQRASRPMQSGLLTKKIEQQLEIEPRTVETCLLDIRKKLAS